jgi:3-hydroxyacyl-[acyl-carrier-protein] dehydratase
LGFNYVDKILELVPGKSICAIKTIRPNEEIFEVHYPGFPVIPGSFLIEMMAQTAGKCLDVEKRVRGMAMLVKIKSASFRKYVGPDQTLSVYGEILTNRDAFATAACKILLAGETVAAAELFFTFIPFQNLAVGFEDLVLESYLKDNPTS